MTLTRSSSRSFFPAAPCALLLTALLGMSACGEPSGLGGGSSGAPFGGAPSGGAEVGGGTESGGASSSGGGTKAGGSSGVGGVPSGGGSVGGQGVGGQAPSGGAGVSPSGGAGDGGAASTGGATSGTGSEGSGGASGGSAPAIDWPMINGIQWADTDGNPIQAHGGGVLRVGEYYYWFGENRNPDGTFYAVTAYRSLDLRQWEFRNHVLHMTTDPDLNPANVERPKVVYNESTGKFVMWMHWENGMDYGEARAAVASSDTVDGDYDYHGSFRPFADSGVMDHGKPGYMSRDCTLFVDDDEAGYFLSTTNENYDLNLYRLTPDYLEPAELAATLFVGGHREAPALFKRNGVYFLVTSGSTGWDPNQGKYATSTNLLSGWSGLADLGDGTTYFSQSTYVVEVEGAAGARYLYMGDRWAGAYGGRVNDSAYLWQPLEFASDTQVSMAWNNVLQLDATRGSIEGTIEDFAVRNRKNGLVLDVDGGGASAGAAIVLAEPSAAPTQTWKLDYNKRGHFRLINRGTGLLVDVPDESTEDGIALIQYEDHDGDNQSWRVMDVGGGSYLLRNENSEKFMGVAGGATSPGAVVEQRAQTGGEEQLWEFVPVD